MNKNIIYSVIFVIIMFFPELLYAQDCKSRVYIISDEDSYIFINNKYYGKKEVQIELSTGLYPILIKDSINKWNAKEIVDTVKITNCNNEYSFFYKMSLSKKTEINNIFKNKITDINVNTKLQWTDSDWFKILIGTSTIFGAAAAFFKIKADKKYDEYLQTGDKGILREVNKLDLYSGIAFGMLQINFGYLIYKFLTE